MCDRMAKQKSKKKKIKILYTSIVNAKREYSFDRKYTQINTINIRIKKKK